MCLWINLHPRWSMKFCMYEYIFCPKILILTKRNEKFLNLYNVSFMYVVHKIFNNTLTLKIIRRSFAFSFLNINLYMLWHKVVCTTHKKQMCVYLRCKGKETCNNSWKIQLCSWWYADWWPLIDDIPEFIILSYIV